ncbi:TlpA family protein disulfide reductase [Neolewinella antarctica]|uniref:Peroxiredoxin n=1 Tax=Neolewinella antarctica TaxID=442734 RepID=A0ABX0X8E7_9BACT|nr:TlpA disulfide reductase family protein [Neolewinella antarctica]NJC25310.1 peroxiredoxin [Neolewinella antarctica]
MKFFSYLFGLMLLLSFTSCGEEVSGSLVKGQLTGAENLQVALDQVMIAEEAKQKAIAAIGPDGSFALGFVEGLAPGIYQLRIGAQTALLSVETDEKVISITGQLTDLNDYTFKVTGSPSTEQLQTTMQSLRKGQLQMEDVERLISEIESPNTAAFVAYSVLGRAGGAALPIHEATLGRLADSNPNKVAYQQYVAALTQRQNAQKATERIQVGQPAPDITLNSPDGTQYKLSDLRGQVVLLDFWAAWCRPCRAENPNVVKVYDRYKNDGFTIYSVSLDGMDARRTANMNADQLAAATENSRQRWVAAIEQDKLAWPYHVSELKHWDSSAARDYGVRGIPRTFLVDREGKIAAVGLRGAASIEQALKKLI